jgi:hypothetical protein
MTAALEQIRAKIVELEAKLADLRTAEHELEALEPSQPAAATRKPKAKRPGRPHATAPRSSKPRQTIAAAIRDILAQHGALPLRDIAAHIKTTNRRVKSQSVANSLKEMRRRGILTNTGGEWALAKARRQPVNA